MKTLLNCLSALFLSVMSLAACAKETVSSAPSPVPAVSESEMVDAWGAVNDSLTQPSLDNAKTVAEFLESLLKSKNNQGYVEKLVDALGRAGLKGGWAQQIGKLKGIGKVLGIVGRVLDFGTTGVKVWDAYQTGNSESFKKSVTDYIINTTASVLGGLVATAVAGSGTLAGWGVSAPFAFAAGVAAGKGTEEAIKWALNKYARQYIEQFLQRVWDATYDGGSNLVSPSDLEGLDGNQGDGNGGVKDPNGGGKKPTYDKPQGIKAHRWGAK